MEIDQFQLFNGSFIQVTHEIKKLSRDCKRSINQVTFCYHKHSGLESWFDFNLLHIKKMKWTIVLIPCCQLISVFGARLACRGAGGDGSSGRSLPVHGHPDSPHLAAAAQWGDTVWAERRPAQPAGLPLALPLQTRHQPQAHPHVSHMSISSYFCSCALGNGL